MGRKKLVAYYRVSTKQQGESGLGLEGQVAAVATFARTNGAEIVRAYREVETSKRSDRPELLKAIAHAQRSRAGLIIAKLDRLARNVAFTANLMESGVDFVACDNPHANRLTIHILAAVAENEARMISERTRAALVAYKARGGVLGAARPGGTPVDPRGRCEGPGEGPGGQEGERRRGERRRGVRRPGADDGRTTRRGLGAAGDRQPAESGRAHDPAGQAVDRYTNRPGVGAGWGLIGREMGGLRPPAGAAARLGMGNGPPGRRWPFLARPRRPGGRPRAGRPARPAGRPTHGLGGPDLASFFGHFA
jgi:DNA invertase Pin-like site-specific DNA recombinase